VTDLSTVTHREFESCVAERFRLTVEEEPTLELTLDRVEVSEVDPTSQESRRSFALVFCGPLEPVLSQQIYCLESESLGALELFLVPIGPAGDAMQYEAIFT
jgi:hypothetical protein